MNEKYCELLTFKLWIRVTETPSILPEMSTTPYGLNYPDIIECFFLHCYQGVFACFDLFDVFLWYNFIRMDMVVCTRLNRYIDITEQSFMKHFVSRHFICHTECRIVSRTGTFTFEGKKLEKNKNLISMVSVENSNISIWILTVCSIT